MGDNLEDLLKFEVDYLDKACNEIDAALFTGDVFFSATNRKVMTLYICRWLKALSDDWEAIEAGKPNE